MKVFKKLVYFYLTFLLLAWLFLPFAVQAEDFGSVYPTINRNQVFGQIEREKAYGFKLNVAEHPATSFYFSNITDIILYKLEGSSTLPEQIVHIGTISDPDYDVKSRFENYSGVIVSNPTVNYVKIYALVNYADNASQTRTFTTEPNPFTVIANSNPTNQNSNTAPILTPPASTNIPTTTTPSVQQSSGGGGSITTYIFGAACNKDNIITCYTGKIIRLFVVIASVGSVFMIIVGGIMLITSGGDPKKIATGKTAITSAIIGLIIVLLSLSIQLFIQNRLTGNNTLPQTTDNNNNNTNTQGTPLPSTINITQGLYNISYTRTASGQGISEATATAEIKQNQCTSTSFSTAIIDGKSVDCSGLLLSNLRAAYEEDGNYHLKGIVINLGNGNAKVYYKKDLNSNQEFFDTWTAAITISAPAASPGTPVTPATPGATPTPINTPADPAAIGTNILVVPNSLYSCSYVQSEIKKIYTSVSIKSIVIESGDVTIFYVKTSGGDILYDIWGDTPDSNNHNFFRTDSGINLVGTIPPTSC